MTMDEVPEHLDAVVRAVAERMSLANRGLLSPDDLRQEAYLYLLDHPKVLNDWADPDDLDKPLAYFGKIVARACQRSILEERVRATGCQPSDFFFYGFDLVEDLLPALFDEGDWAVGHEVDDSVRRRRKSPAEGGDSVAMMVDISRGYNLLGDIDQQVLRERFAPPGRTYEQLADVWDVSVSTAHGRVRRALEHLIDHLGGESPWE